MIKFKNTEIYGLEHAIRGMRNPLKSWDRSDTFEYSTDIGENDKRLMKKLFDAGTEHRKYLRMITVWTDIEAPLYWIAEHDTYKVGTTRNSCSFMHKGLEKPFERSDFSITKLGWNEMLDYAIEILNELREKYLETKDEEVFQTIRQLLPSGYNQRYTWCANYEVLANIYKQRKNHRLSEWKEFCKWIEKLPFSELITGGEE